MASIVTRARAFIAARLDSDKHLGLHLTLALLIASLALWGFGTLLDSVLDNATLVRLDTALHARILAHVTPGGVTFFNLVSTIGSPASMQALGVIGAGILLWQRRRAALVAWIFAFVGGGIIQRVIKISVHRHRPAFVAAGESFGPFSFPSGHAAWSFLALGMLVYLLTLYWHPRPPWRAIVIVVAIAMVALIGVGRVYLGVHFPSDVLGGWVVAAAWLGICGAALAITLHAEQVSSARGTR